MWSSERDGRSWEVESLTAAATLTVTSGRSRLRWKQPSSQRHPWMADGAAPRPSDSSGGLPILARVTLRRTVRCRARRRADQARSRTSSSLMSATSLSPTPAYRSAQL